MLMLVLANNLLVTFFGWEGVGVCSYFLIAFWFERPERGERRQEGDDLQPHRRRRLPASRSSSSSSAPGASTTSTVFSPPRPDLDDRTWSAIALLLFLGAVGKSAQIPLFPWLADAMEGPTPVSALIHAATMVTAGVYLMCPDQPDPAPRAGRRARHRLGRRRDGVRRRDDRLRADRHQEGARLLDGLPARLHVPRRRLRRLRGGDLFHADARLLQGAAVPRRRLGDPRHGRRAGHQEDGGASRA